MKDEMKKKIITLFNPTDTIITKKTNKQIMINKQFQPEQKIKEKHPWISEKSCTRIEHERF